MRRKRKVGVLGLFIGLIIVLGFGTLVLRCIADCILEKRHVMEVYDVPQRTIYYIASVRLEAKVFDELLS